MPPPNGSGPLAGVKVLDLTRFQNGPTATVMMADHGADVVKVEPPQGGDPGRMNVLKDGYQWYNEAFNRGKRSLTLDLRAPEARPVMEKLVRWADVMLDNFRPGVMDTMGYSYEWCKNVNPGIIYASNSGFGPVGHMSKNGSYDVICQGTSGAMMYQGGGPDHTPLAVEWGMADQVGAMNFAFAVLSAVLARERHPQRLGQKLETSQLGAMLHFQSFWLQTYLHTKRQRNDGKMPWTSNPVMNKYKCGDEKWLICAPVEEKMWPKVCRALGQEELLTDPHTADRATRLGNPKNSKFLTERFTAVFASKPRQHWLDALAREGVPCGPVYSYEDIEKDDHFWENGYLQRLPHRRFPDKDTMVVGVPNKFHATPTAVQSNAPDLGEHRQEVLADVCGLSAAEIAALDAKGVTRPQDNPLLKGHFRTTTAAKPKL